MKAIELTGMINNQGQLILDQPLENIQPSRVKVILLLTETSDEIEALSTPLESIKASLIKSLQQARAGERIPLAQMWEGIDVE